MQVLIIYNPAAGRLPARPFIYRSARVLRENGWGVRIVATRNSEHTVELARQAAGNVEVVFAVGGDGTVGQIASGLAGSTTALGILPAGTQNVMAAELGLRPFGWSRWWALEENIRQLMAAPIYNVDVGVCNGHLFLLWTGLGLDARTIEQVEPRPRFEKYFAVTQYVALTVWNATIWHGMDLKVYVDGRIVEGHYLLAVVTNIRSYLGGLALILPKARLDDGQMDLWLFSGANLGDAIRHALGMLSGHHQEATDVLCVPFRTLRIESTTAFSLQTDGESQKRANRVDFSILPRSLRLIIPRGSLSLLVQAEKPVYYEI